MGKKNVMEQLFQETLNELEELGKTPELQKREQTKREERASAKDNNPKDKEKNKPAKEEKKKREERPKDEKPEPTIPSPEDIEEPDAPDIYEEEAKERPEEEAKDDAGSTIQNPASFSVSSKKVGAEVTKEHVKALKGKPKDGFRGTLIIHRKVVDTSGNLLEDKKEINPKDSGILADKSLYLIRNDTGEAYEISRNLTIGKDIDNDIVLSDPEAHYVSGYHADIELKGKEVWLIDKDSTNGTKVNGSRIKKKRLYPGNEVILADLHFTVSER